MTRSHKANGRDHKGIAEGTAVPVENVPKFFAMNGYAGVDPKKIKKDGAGKGNWGGFGQEVVDEDFSFTNARRRSNSSSLSHHISEFKTKFDVNEKEPVFEESVHGPILEEEVNDDLARSDTSDSGRSST
jgi:hypothetical protein